MFHIKLLVSFILIYTISLTAFAEDLIIPTHVPAIKVATGDPGKEIGPGIFLEEGAGLSFDISVFSMGHEVGNGGFAFDKSIIALQAAADELIEQIEQTDYPMFDEFPERREILLEVLPFERLEQYLLLSAQNNGQPLWLGYDVNPRKVMVFQLFYMAFWRYKDKDFAETVQEIKQLLLHEASHIWGFNQEQAREFSQDCLHYLNNVSSPFVKADGQISLNIVHYAMFALDEFELNAFVSPEVASHLKLGNLFNWCTEELSGDSSHCVLEAVDNEGTIVLIPIIFSDVNSFIVKLTEEVSPGHYRVRLLETYSGARSNEFYLHVMESEPVTPTPAPSSSVLFPYAALNIMPISQYSCVDRTGEAIVGYDDEMFWHWHHSVKLHYYFPQGTKPQPLPPGEHGYVCHDALTYGIDDSFEFPRLDEISDFLFLWSLDNPYFFDSDNDGILDINNVIHQMLVADGVPVTSVSHIFTELQLPMTYISEEADLIAINTHQGFMMNAFLDDNTGHWFCPTVEDYFSGNKVFETVGNVVGMVNTEALYMAKREPVVFPGDVTAPDDFIAIKESLLKKIWFYHENDQYYEPNEETARTKTIMFYWPADFGEPWVKKEHQKLYTIQQSASSDDNRIGCIPDLL